MTNYVTTHGSSSSVQQRLMGRGGCSVPPPPSYSSSYPSSSYSYSSLDNMLKSCPYHTHMGPHHSYSTTSVRYQAPLIKDSTLKLGFLVNLCLIQVNMLQVVVQVIQCGNRVAKVIFRKLEVEVDISMFFLGGPRSRHQMLSLQVLFQYVIGWYQYYLILDPHIITSLCISLLSLIYCKCMPMLVHVPTPIGDPFMVGSSVSILSCLTRQL